MDKKNSGGMNIGTSSILVTFVLLCLVTFSALAYMSARSDYKLSKQTAERTASYYDANRMAEIYMANIEGLLSKHAAACKNEDEYLKGIDKIFADNENIKINTDEGKVTISYNVVISDAQNLDIVLSAHYPDVDDSTLFHIDKWATEINTEYVEELKNNTFEGDGPKLLF